MTHKMTQKQLLERLGTRGDDGMPKLPDYAIDGTTRANSNMLRVSRGMRPYFVCLPDSTYRPTEDELKPFQDYAKAQNKDTKSTSKATVKESGA